MFVCGKKKRVTLFDFRSSSKRVNRGEWCKTFVKVLKRTIAMVTRKLKKYKALCISAGFRSHVEFNLTKGEFYGRKVYVVITFKQISAD